MRFFDFFFNNMPQGYQNEKSPILNGQKKPRTWGKVQKIRDLEGVGLFHPFENTLYLHWTAGALSIKVNWNGNGEDNREQKLKGFISQLILFFCTKELDICASFILFVSKHHHGIRSPLTLSTYNVSSTSDYQQIMLMILSIAVAFTEAFNFIIVSDSILYLAQLIW